MLTALEARKAFDLRWKYQFSNEAKAIMADIHALIAKAIENGEPNIEYSIKGIDSLVVNDVENRLIVQGYRVQKSDQYALYLTF